MSYTPSFTYPALALWLSAAPMVLAVGGCPEETRIIAQCGGAQGCSSGFVCFESDCLDRNGDLDGDGLSNGVEADNGLYPTRVDSDGDGIDDGVEFGAGPLPSDRDGDGTIDALEHDGEDADCDGILNPADPDDASPNLCGAVDECATDNGGCAQGCADTVESFECTCQAGWVLGADGFACEDVDECAAGNGGCAGTCTNSDGSFSCGCDAGFQLGADGLTCDDVDECAASNGGCGQVCVNTVGGYDCGCNSGWELASDGTSCVDVDECMNANGGCQGTCVNEANGFVCGCWLNASLASDGVSCECDAGWQLAADGVSCVDADECAANNGGCDDLCSNNDGSFVCGCAGTGKVLASDDVSCECGPTWVPDGEDGCNCAPGYSPAAGGETCEDLDECLNDNGGCAHYCSNTDGSFECSCDIGWTLAGDGAGCDFGCVEHPVTGQCYTRVPGPVDAWTLAHLSAEATTYMGMRGRLLVLNDSDEEQWVAENLGLDDVWLGAYQDIWEPAYSEPNGGWRWVTGEAFAHTSWALGSPDDAPAGSRYLGTDASGAWQDYTSWPQAGSNKGYIIEFEASPAVRFVGQDNDNLLDFRTATAPHAFALGDGYYGTEGYVLYGTHSLTYSGGGSIIVTDPLTMDTGTFETLSDLPSYLSVENNGQNSMAAGFFGSASFDDPRETPGSGVKLRASLALHNFALKDVYIPVVDLVIGPQPPPVIRVGVMMRGFGVDQMEATKLERVTGTPLGATAVRVGEVQLFMHFYDIVAPAEGDRFTLTIVNVNGNNPNVSYFGLTFD